MSNRIYATVGDKVVFVSTPKGWYEHEGQKGNWKTEEGTVVIDNVEVEEPYPENFSKKYKSILELWPNATVRFHN